VSFEHFKYIPLVIFLFITFSLIVVKAYRNYVGTVEKYWFFVPSILLKYRLQTFLLSFLILGISTLDLRGPEERIKATIPDQKTIIIIDSSASMLAEDVKPNRFQRSLFLARHFIKRAAGHQIAVVLFSDTQKRLVPFTDDIDLLDARVAALEKISLANGNSNINQAVKESLQYFKIDNDSKKIVGNILLFTDSEEHGGNFPLDEGTDVNMAVVGVGTAAGAPIPLRSKSGVFLNYKTHKGEKVTTKLNESIIKGMGKDFKNFKYWIATSYIIPTDDILQFFRGIYKKKLGETDIRIRPVYGHYIVVLGIFVYFLSSLLGLGKSFQKPTVLAILLLGISGFNHLKANDADLSDEAVKEVKVPPEVIKRQQNLKKGVATEDEKKFLAEEFLLLGKAKEASTLYEEINSTQAKDINTMVNMGTAYASAGNIKKALDSFESATQKMPEGKKKEELKDVIRNNILVAIKKQNQKKKDQKDKKDKKNKDKDKKKDKNEKKDKKDKSGEGSSGDEKKENDQKNKSKDQKEKKDKKSKKEDEKKKESEKNKQKQEEAKDSEQDQTPSTLEQKEKDIKKKRKLVKIPAMLKQIMDQDRNLQEQYYRTNQKRKRNNNNEVKDW
jgi:Ca-activated chloride channel family protein